MSPHRFLLVLLIFTLLCSGSLSDKIYPQSKSYEDFESGLGGWNSSNSEDIDRVGFCACAGWELSEDGCSLECCSECPNDYCRQSSYWPSNPLINDHVRLRAKSGTGEAYIQRSIPTTGYMNIQLEYARSVRHMGSMPSEDEGGECEGMIVEYWNGSHWDTIKDYCPSSYNQYIYSKDDQGNQDTLNGKVITKDLSGQTDANDNPEFKIRFRTYNAECDEAAFVDHIRLEGTPCTTDGATCPTDPNDCCSGKCDGDDPQPDEIVCFSCDGKTNQLTGECDDKCGASIYCDDEQEGIIDRCDEGKSYFADTCEGCVLNDATDNTCRGEDYAPGCTADDECDGREPGDTCEGGVGVCNNSCQCELFPDGHQCTWDGQCAGDGCDYDLGVCFSCTSDNCGGVDHCNSQTGNCESRCDASNSCDNEPEGTTWQEGNTCHSCSQCDDPADTDVGNGMATCQCSGNDCPQGYCQTSSPGGDICYYQVDCGSNGWTYQGTCILGGGCTGDSTSGYQWNETTCNSTYPYCHSQTKDPDSDSSYCTGCDLTWNGEEGCCVGDEPEDQETCSSPGGQPELTSISHSPDQQKGDLNITFNSTASDPEGEEIKLFICKNTNCQNCSVSDTSECWATSDWVVEDPSATMTCPNCTYLPHQQYGAIVYDASSLSSNCLQENFTCQKEEECECGENQECYSGNCDTFTAGGGDEHCCPTGESWCQSILACNASCTGLDSNSPTVSIQTDYTGEWQNEPANASVNCTDQGTDQETGCNETSSRLETYDCRSAGKTVGCPQSYDAYSIYHTQIPYEISSWQKVCAAAKDQAGNVGFSMPVEFKIEKEEPGVTIEGPDSPTDRVITLTFNDTGGSKLKVCNYMFYHQEEKGEPWVNRGVQSVECNGTNQTEVEIYIQGNESDCPPTNNASHKNCYLFAQAQDWAKNSNASNNSFQVMNKSGVDLYSFKPANNSEVNSSHLLLNFSSTPATPVKCLAILEGDKSHPDMAEDVNSIECTGQAYNTTHSCNISFPSEENQSVWIACTDEGGVYHNASTNYELRYDVDKERPTVAILSPSNNTDIEGKNWVMVEFKTNHSDVQRFERMKRGGWKRIVNTTSINNYTIYQYNFSNLLHGFQTLGLRACDDRGCGNHSSLTLNVTGQFNTYPEVTIISPINGKEYPSKVPLLLFKAVDDTAYQMTCNYAVDEGSYQEIREVRNNTQTNVQINVREPGEHEVKVKCYDGQSWTQPPEESDFSISNQPPVVIIHAPHENQNYTVNATEKQTWLNLTFIAQDDSNNNLSCYYSLDSQEEWVHISDNLVPGLNVTKDIRVEANQTASHNIRVKCEDSLQAESTAYRNFTARLLASPLPENQSTPPPQKTEEEEEELKKKEPWLRLLEGFVPPGWLPFVILAIIILIIIAVSGGTWYAKQKSSEAAREKIVKEKLKDRKARLKHLKKRRKKLRRASKSLAQREVTLGLTNKEKTRKETYEHELLRTQERLLRMPEFIGELNEKAEEALQRAKKGVSSKKIMKKLKKEGYSNQEIKAIKKVFRKKKKEWENKKN